MSNPMAELDFMLPLGLFDLPSMVVLGILAVLLFGGELPKMGRKFGKFYSEFQRSVGAFKSEVSSVVSDITSEINDTSPSRASKSASRKASSGTAAKKADEDEMEEFAPKFEPPKK